MTLSAAAPLAAEAADRLLATFRRAAAAVPAYRTLLAEQGVNVDQVTDVAAFSRLCPLLSKANTFERFPIDQLGAPGCLSNLADVLTSSGRGGSFSFGLSTRTQAAAAVAFLDDAFDEAFAVRSHKTLAVNCLPMGVGFSSHVMTLATTSVREDMVAALVQTFGSEYDQLVLVGDPLFLKRLTDHAATVQLDWRRYRMNAIVGEEVFGEHYRSYLMTCLGADVARPDRGYVMSSFGVGELGLHLGYETRTTITLRRAAHADPRFARALFGSTLDEGAPLPMLFAFNPLRTFLEIVEPDAARYGRLTTSMLDPDRPIPLLRYQTGDVAALLDAAHVADVAAQHGIDLPGALPRALFALRGRETEALPNGAHVAIYKDSLYANAQVAGALTGAVRLVFAGTECTMHVQLIPSAVASPLLETQILAALPVAARPSRLVQWLYSQFPFAMTLDYERKFAYYVPGEGIPTTSRMAP